MVIFQSITKLPKGVKITTLGSFLGLWRIPLSLSVMGLCHPHGMMECWSIGIVGTKIGNNTIIVLLPLIPFFQYSSCGKVHELLWKKQVAKIFTKKLRRLQNHPESSGRSMMGFLTKPGDLF
jgi:hypothetical protein